MGIPKQKGEKFHRVREPVPLQDELTNRGPLEPPLLFNNPHSPLPPPDPQE